MIAAIARARIPWPTVVMSASAATVVVAMAVLPPSTWVSPFFVRVVVLALAGSAAYVIDDCAAAVTAAAPRSLWRRRARAMWWGGSALTASWLVIVAVLRAQDAGLPLRALTLELVVLCCLGVAAATLLSWRGDPEPGSVVSPAVLLLGLGAVLAQNVLQITIFVPDAGAMHPSLHAWWLGTGVVCLLVILGATRDPARR